MWFPPVPSFANIGDLIFFGRSFTTLDAHIKALKDEEIANALAGAPAKKKSRAADEIEDGGKKRKAKTKASQGVEKLKKANVSGMAKISSFFQKK
jgi:ribonuclease H2 subunit B